MTMRSKQWYTRVSRLPNSLRKVSIGPLPSWTLPQQQDHGTGGRWAVNDQLWRERLPRPPGLAESPSAHAGRISSHGPVSRRRAVRLDRATVTLVLVDRRESGGGVWPQRRCGARPLLLHRDGVRERT